MPRSMSFTKPMWTELFKHKERHQSGDTVFVLNADCAPFLTAEYVYDSHSARAHLSSEKSSELPLLYDQRVIPEHFYLIRNLKEVKLKEVAQAWPKSLNDFLKDGFGLFRWWINGKRDKKRFVDPDDALEHMQRDSKEVFAVHADWILDMKGRCNPESTDDLLDRQRIFDILEWENPYSKKRTHHSAYSSFKRQKTGTEAAGAAAKQ